MTQSLRDRISKISGGSQMGRKCWKGVENICQNYVARLLLPHKYIGLWNETENVTMP